MLSEELGSVKLPILGDSAFPLVVKMVEVFGTLLLIGWVGNGMAAQLVPSVVGCLRDESFLQLVEELLVVVEEIFEMDGLSITGQALSGTFCAQYLAQTCEVVRRFTGRHQAECLVV